MPQGLFYKSPAWEKLKAQVLKRDGYRCRKCGQLALGRNRNGVSPVVDHIQPRADVNYVTPLDVAANLEVVCLPCHNKKTVFEDLNERPAIGPDGFPIGGKW